MTYRAIGSNRFVFDENKQGASTVAVNRVQDIESILARCKFFDPSTPGTLIEGSLAAGTFQRNVRFENITSSVTFRNNYMTTIEATVYLCQVKDDTDLAPLTAWANGLSDGTNLTSIFDLGQYPSDYDVVKDLYKLKVAKKVILAPGESCSTFHKTGAFEYSPSTVDAHPVAYQTEYKSFDWLVVAKGCVGHDVGISSIANMPGGLDVSWTNVYKVKYDAGVNIRFTHVDNSNAASFPNGGVMSQKPIGENQAFSIS